MSSNETDFFEIDQNALDLEWCRQPALYHEYAMKLADARQEYERAKAEKELVFAEMDAEVRIELAKNGSKITENVVSNAVTDTLSYQEIVKKVIAAKYAVDVAEAAVWTLDHRKKALQDLVQLRLADYYSEPRLPSGQTQEVRKRKVRSAGQQRIDE